MLNKITGCESRTVPPLYVLMFLFWRKPVTGAPWEGRKKRGSSPPQGISQKTYEVGSPIIREITDDVHLSQENGCGTVIGAAAYYFWFP